MQRKPHLRLAIINDCNLSCVYCRPGGEGVETSDVMSMDEILKTLRAGSLAGFHHLKITGGEPLIRQKKYHDLFDVIREVKKEALFDIVEMVTNGVYICDYLDEILNCGLDSITISLDTASKYDFKKITLADKYEEVVQGIREIRKAGMKANINAVVSSINIGTINDLISLADQLNIDLKLIDYVKFGDSVYCDNTPMDYVDFSPIYDYVNDRAVKKYILYPHGGLGTPMKVYELKSGVKIIVKDATVGTNYNSDCKECEYYPCQDALISIRITADGAIKKCLIRDDNLVYFIEDLRNGNMKKVEEIFYKAFIDLENSEYCKGLWRAK